MIDITLHRQILLGILKDIFQNKNLAPILGFKGGTCLYFFHDLPRFSTDLDFNLIQNASFNKEELQKILVKYITITDFKEKKNTWFWLGSYKKTHHNVKVEISKRIFNDKYELLDLYGIPVQCMNRAHLFAHKLCAITDRSFIANRDIYDCNFMFDRQFPIARQIIEQRTGMKMKEYFEKLIRYIPSHISKRGILDGLGEMLPSEQKNQTKQNLLSSLLFYLTAAL